MPLNDVTINIIRCKRNVLLCNLLRKVCRDCLGFEEIPLVGLAVDDSLVAGVGVQGERFVAFFAPEWKKLNIN